MKTILPFTLALPLLIVAPVTISACKTTQMAGAQTDDMRIQGRIGRRLASDPEVRRFQIDVDVLNGVATLRGNVDNQTIAEEAVQIAQTTEGVKSVVNQMQVGGEDKVLDGDLGIRTEVGTKLAADPDIRRMNVDVDVVNGIVYLSGIVHDEVAKEAAERIASNVEGVVEVKNELQIDPDDTPLSKDTELPEDQQQQPDSDEAQPGTMPSGAEVEEKP